MSKKRLEDLLWIVEPICNDSSYIERPMFGCRACYHRGRLKVVLAGQAEPWNGAMFPTERHHQPSVIAEFPELEPHPVLGKWLYLSLQSEEFESTCEEVMKRIVRDDERFGVIPPPKKSRAKNPSTSHADKVDKLRPPTKTSKRETSSKNKSVSVTRKKRSK